MQEEVGGGGGGCLDQEIIINTNGVMNIYYSIGGQRQQSVSCAEEAGKSQHNKRSNVNREIRKLKLRKMTTTEQTKGECGRL